MRTFIRNMTIGLTFFAGSLSVVSGAFAYQHHSTHQQPFHSAPAPLPHAHRNHHDHHEYGLTRRQARHAGLHDIAANFRRVDRNHDGLVTRSEIAAFRHREVRHHWHHR